jgi:hypothetical protein
MATTLQGTRDYMPIFALIPGFNGLLLPKQDSNAQEASEFFNRCSCLEINDLRVTFDAIVS